MASPDKLPPRIGDIPFFSLFSGNLENPPGSISTGFGDLDKLLSGGLQRQELTIFFGLPGVGKTSFAVNLAVNTATENTGVYFVSPEMSQEWVGRRAMSVLANVDTRSLILGTNNHSILERITQVQRTVENLPFYIDDNKAITLESVYSKAKALREEAEIGLVVIDRLERINSPVLGLRDLAREIDVSVVGIANATTRNWPRSHHLEDADTVIRLHQEALFMDEQEFGTRYPTRVYPQGIIEARFFKSRSGPLGEVALLYFEKSGKFENLEINNRF